VTARLYADETGEGDPPLVLLHGFGATHRAWSGVRDALGSTPRVLAYDLPGHGGSLALSETGGAKAAAAVILEDLEWRGVAGFHLAGHSFGGAVAALMAMSAPARVVSTTLFAPGGFGPEINAGLLRAFAAAETREEVSRCLARMASGPLPAATVDASLAMRGAPGQMEALGRLCAMITRDGRQGVIPRETLAALAMPVMVVWGGRDAVLPVHQSEDMPPGFSRRILPERGHMLPEETPQETAEILRSMLG
jgi:pimeloyl-ACP methyl ester carboxylesterase